MRSLTLPRRTAVASLLALALAGCAATGSPTVATPQATTQGFPITIKNALGETTIESKPERVVSIAWGNQDVALALGVAPVGIDAQVWNWSGDAKPGVYTWTQQKLDELGAEQPVIFDTTDGVDFEAIADTDPDVVLAALSGISKEDYQTLSNDVAPVVAYPEVAWYTPWREQIRINSEALGLKAEGEALVADLEKQITEASAEAGFEGKTAAFFYASPTDLSTVSIYTAGDPRTALLQDLGFELPQVAVDAMAEGSFYQEISAENADQLAEVDVIVTYGDESLLPALQADPLWSTLPAVKNGAVLAVGNGDDFSAALSPTALSLPWVLQDYVARLSDAAAKVK